ncbi:hypothetical protein TNCV_2544451 [Trichonephila clavipes]|nr:hypothetical protein TNCV_2544451 [Trichonephila clavipes]
MDANKWKSKVDGHPGDPHAPLMIFTYTANDAQHEVSGEGTNVGLRMQKKRLTACLTSALLPKRPQARFFYKTGNRLKSLGARSGL